MGESDEKAKSAQGNGAPRKPELPPPVNQMLDLLILPSKDAGVTWWMF
jgi:hypothetical protein